MKELVSDGIVIFDAAVHKYYMPDGRTIVRQAGENISNAAVRLRAMSLRPRGMPSSNLVTLEDDVQNFYHQAQQYQDSEVEYETDDDDGPYWKVAMQTAQDNRNYGEEEYEDYGEYGYYADPDYQTYPAERTSTRIAEARDRASRIPTRPPPRQKFEGVFPPPRKNQVKPAQPLPPKQAVPNFSPGTSSNSSKSTTPYPI